MFCAFDRESQLLMQAGFCHSIVRPWSYNLFEVVVDPSAIGIEFLTQVEGNLILTCEISGVTAKTMKAVLDRSLLLS